MRSGKRVLLISPHGHLPGYWLPLALGYLKSNTPRPHTVDVLDASLEGLPPRSARFGQRLRAMEPDVVGVSTGYATHAQALETLAVVRGIVPGAVTVLGGAHPTLFAEQLVQEPCVDHVLRGEGERSLPSLLDRLDDGDLAGVPGLVHRVDGDVHVNEVQLEQDLDRFEFPDYDAVRLAGHLDAGYTYGGLRGRSAPIWTTRGCPFGCAYCAASCVNGRAVRTHSIDYLMEWLEHLHRRFHISRFAIIDDGFTHHVDHARRFCEAVQSARRRGKLPPGTRFATPNGVRLDRLDEDLLGAMRAAGWTSLTIAPESGSRDTLRRMGKTLDPDTVPGVVEQIRSAGLKARGFFMVGYPGETLEDLDATIRLIRRCRFDTINITLFTPYPGTPVHDELVRDGIVPPGYLPPDTLKNQLLPFQERSGKGPHTPEAFEDFSLFGLLLRENARLVLRNPRALFHGPRYYGVHNILRKLYALAVRDRATP